MTIDEEAMPILDAHDLDREDLLLATKCIAQNIIDESAGSDTPLSGLVYDVWGLYNDGMPKCRWTAPYEDDDVVFSGQFRVTGEDAFVVRRKVLNADELLSVVRQVYADRDAARAASE